MLSVIATELLLAGHLQYFWKVDAFFLTKSIQPQPHWKENLSRKTIIRYAPKELPKEISKIIDTDIEVKAKLLDIIGGYGHKETLGALIDIAI